MLLKRCRGRKLKADTEEDAAYDRAARELVFEAKGQVGLYYFISTRQLQDQLCCQFINPAVDRVRLTEN
jgi:hypothetical protein